MMLRVGNHFQHVLLWHPFWMKRDHLDPSIERLESRHLGSPRRNEDGRCVDARVVLRGFKDCVVDWHPLGYLPTFAWGDTSYDSGTVAPHQPDSQLGFTPGGSLYDNLGAFVYENGHGSPPLLIYDRLGQRIQILLEPLQRQDDRDGLAAMEFAVQLTAQAFDTATFFDLLQRPAQARHTMPLIKVKWAPLNMADLYTGLGIAFRTLAEIDGDSPT
jgi:hypothetical protein